jgi:hypothetical protein
MLYSLTDKLKFNDSPQIQIKDKVLTVNNSARTVLELMDTVLTGGDLEGAKATMNLLFSEKDRKTIEKMNLSIEDYMTLAGVAMDLALGNDPDADNRGE